MKTEEEKRAAKRAYYKAHAARYTITHRAWVEANREHVRTYDNAYRAALRADPEIKESIAIVRRARKKVFLSNPDNYSKNYAQRLVTMSKNPKHYIFMSKKASAKSDGIEFSLVEENIVWPEYCPVLGILLVYSRGDRNRNRTPRSDSPSFDRIDPTKGYTPENTLIVSNRANMIKNNASPDEIMRVARFYAALKTDFTLSTASL